MSLDFGSSLMDEVMKSLGSSTSDGHESAKPSTSTAEISTVSARAAQQRAETNGQAEVATARVVAGNVASPDEESASDTESDDSDDTTSSESTVSADDNCTAGDADIARSSQTVSSPAVMLQFVRCCCCCKYECLLYVCHQTTLKYRPLYRSKTYKCLEMRLIFSDCINGSTSDVNQPCTTLV